MDEQESKPAPEDPLVNTGEDEVERLLDQAQELANDISTTIGVEPEQAYDEDTTPAPPAADEPVDPVAATENAEQTLAELEGLLTGGDPAPTDPPAAGHRGAKTDAPPDADTEPDAISPRQKTQSPSADVLLDGDLCGDIDVDLGEPGREGRSPDVGPDQAGTRSNKRRIPRSFKELLALLKAAALAAPGSAASALQDSIISALLLIDRPFADLSPATKRYLGYAAIVTLLMGLASFILPGWLEHNPYRDMAP